MWISILLTLGLLQIAGGQGGLPSIATAARIISTAIGRASRFAKNSVGLKDSCYSGHHWVVHGSGGKLKPFSGGGSNTVMLPCKKQNLKGLPQTSIKQSEVSHKRTSKDIVYTMETCPEFDKLRQAMGVPNAQSIVFAKV